MEWRKWWGACLQEMSAVAGLQDGNSIIWTNNIGYKFNYVRGVRHTALGTITNIYPQEISCFEFLEFSNRTIF